MYRPEQRPDYKLEYLTKIVKNAIGYTITTRMAINRFNDLPGASSGQPARHRIRREHHQYQRRTQPDGWQQVGLTGRMDIPCEARGHIHTQQHQAREQQCASVQDLRIAAIHDVRNQAAQQLSEVETVCAGQLGLQGRCGRQQAACCYQQVTDRMCQSERTGRHRTSPCCLLPNTVPGCGFVNWPSRSGSAVRIRHCPCLR